MNSKIPNLTSSTDSIDPTISKVNVEEPLSEKPFVRFSPIQLKQNI